MPSSPAPPATPAPDPALAAAYTPGEVADALARLVPGAVYQVAPRGGGAGLADWVQDLEVAGAPVAPPTHEQIAAAIDQGRIDVGRRAAVAWLRRVVELHYTTLPHQAKIYDKMEAEARAIVAARPGPAPASPHVSADADARGIAVDAAADAVVAKADAFHALGPALQAARVAVEHGAFISRAQFDAAWAMRRAGIEQALDAAALDIPA